MPAIVIIALANDLNPAIDAQRRLMARWSCSMRLLKLLKQFHMTQSMSRKGNCWDNAPMESFFKTLKVERTYRLRYTSRDQARLDIVNWVEGFYNEKRLHSAIDYRSPADFERSLKAA
jgi:putative transposase